MRRIVLTYGLIAGGILAALMFVTFPLADRIGFDRMMIVGYTSMVIAFLLIYVGVKTYRDTVGGGRVGFGRALWVGIAITLVATCCYVGAWQVVQRTIATDFSEKYAAHEIERIRADGGSEAAVAAKQAEMADFQEMYANPLWNIAFTFLEPLPVGVIMSLVSAGLVSRRPRTA